jgi:chromosome segregation ATPase
MCFVDDTKALKAKLAQAEISIASLDKHRRELDQTRQRLNAELAAAEAQIAEMNQKCISLSLHESRMAAAEALVIEKHDQTLRFIAELEKANQRIKELEQRLKPEPYVHTKDWPT